MFRFPCFGSLGMEAGNIPCFSCLLALWNAWTVQCNSHFFPPAGVDPCEVWCSQPVEKLREYCNVIKIRIFGSLFCTMESASFLEEHGWVSTFSKGISSKSSHCSLLPGEIPCVLPAGLTLLQECWGSQVGLSCSRPEVLESTGRKILRMGFWKLESLGIRSLESLGIWEAEFWGYFSI